jgi:hypothetical protein
MREDITTIERNGINIELEFDDDGFPIVVIDTGDSYMDVEGRPTVSINLNGKNIHEMFDMECGCNLECGCT